MEEEEETEVKGLPKEEEKDMYFDISVGGDWERSSATPADVEDVVIQRCEKESVGH